MIYLQMHSFKPCGAARREIYLQKRFRMLTRECIHQMGFLNEHIAFDPPRLRVITHNGHLNPLADAVYYPHRDTWYGHPTSLITWWIPLDDLSEAETFVFYPEKFSSPVPNTSHIFNYDEWVSKGWDFKIGWQKVSTEHRLKYPSVCGDVQTGRSIGFSCKQGANLLFSGAHFHATIPQSLGRTRFSLDFRIVDMRDVHLKKGAPNVDDRSTGSGFKIIFSLEQLNGLSGREFCSSHRKVVDIYPHRLAVQDGERAILIKNYGCVLNSF